MERIAPMHTYYCRANGCKPNLIRLARIASTQRPAVDSPMMYYLSDFFSKEVSAFFFKYFAAANSSLITPTQKAITMPKKHKIVNSYIITLFNIINLLLYKITIYLCLIIRGGYVTFNIIAIMFSLVHMPNELSVPPPSV